MRVATGSCENATSSCTGRNGLIDSGRDGLVRSGRRSRRQALSRSDCDSRLYHDGPVNAAYRAVTFTRSAPESDRDKNSIFDCGPDLPYLTQGDSENHNYL
ncbi:hypothetical protein Taro_052897 [Colocasia esculenta]|uniref:Uncharacterized protein n=1 Tax=Colocasia esculenta TaxID=4460 RepID=A0A843XJR4_COLES|nr:hypothetical protein [Colocasia esculenta]